MSVTSEPIFDIVNCTTKSVQNQNKKAKFDYTRLLQAFGKFDYQVETPIREHYKLDATGNKIPVLNSDGSARKNEYGGTEYAKGDALVVKKIEFGQTFILWRRDQDEDGKTQKVAYQPSGYKASQLDPHTWLTSSEAMSVYQRQDTFDGIGLFLADFLWVVDFDHCGHFDDDSKKFVFDDKDAEQWFLRLNSLTEMSQSKTGLHVFVKIPHELIDQNKIVRDAPQPEMPEQAGATESCPGRKEKGIKNRFSELWILNNHPKSTGEKKPHIELYNRRHFFALTGMVLPGFETLNENTDAIVEMANYMAGVTARQDKPAALREANSTETTSVLVSTEDLIEDEPSDRTDDEIIELIKCDQYTAKYWSAWFAGPVPNGDPSKNDETLCYQVSYYTRSGSQILSIWARSTLGQREKFFERDDYVTRTINKALEARRGKLVYRESPQKTEKYVAPEKEQVEVKTHLERQTFQPDYQVDTVAAGFAKAMGLAERNVLLMAPTGSGKSLQSAISCVSKLRAGERACFVASGLDEQDQFVNQYLFAPDSETRYGFAPLTEKERAMVQVVNGGCEQKEILGSTRLLVIHHTYLARKAFSKQHFAEMFWCSSENKGPCLLIIDEIQKFLKHLRIIIQHGATWTGDRGEKKERGDCPFFKKNGNCSMCKKTDAIYFHPNSGNPELRPYIDGRVGDDYPKLALPQVETFGRSRYKTLVVSNIKKPLATNRREYTSIKPKVEHEKLSPTEYAIDRQKYVNEVYTDILQYSYMPKRYTYTPTTKEDNLAADWKSLREELLEVNEAQGVPDGQKKDRIKEIRNDHSFPKFACGVDIDEMTDISSLCYVFAKCSKVIMLGATLNKAELGVLKYCDEKLKLIQATAAPNKVNELLLVIYGGEYQYQIESENKVRQLLGLMSPDEKVLIFEPTKEKVNSLFAEVKKKRWDVVATKLCDDKNFERHELRNKEDGFSRLTITNSYGPYGTGINRPLDRVCFVNGEVWLPTICIPVEQEMNEDSIRLGMKESIEHVIIQNAARILRTMPGDNTSRKIICVHNTDALDIDVNYIKGAFQSMVATEIKVLQGRTQTYADIAMQEYLKTGNLPAKSEEELLKEMDDNEKRRLASTPDKNLSKEDRKRKRQMPTDLLNKYKSEARVKRQVENAEAKMARQKQKLEERKQRVMDCYHDGMLQRDAEKKTNSRRYPELHKYLVEVYNNTKRSNLFSKPKAQEQAKPITAELVHEPIVIVDTVEIQRKQREDSKSNKKYETLRGEVLLKAKDGASREDCLQIIDKEPLNETAKNNLVKLIAEIYETTSNPLEKRINEVMLDKYLRDYELHCNAR